MHKFQSAGHTYGQKMQNCGLVIFLQIDGIQVGFLASPDALEMIVVTELLSYLLSVSTDLTDVTLVSDDTY